MRIANIDVINLYWEYPDRRGFVYAGGSVTSRVTTLVRVTTESGETGWGSCYAYPDLVRIIIEKHLSPHLLGADPIKTEILWEKMYLLTRWYGRKGVAVSALGALDTAFWDLRGKFLGKPIYKLLGSEQATVPAYASGLFWQNDMSLLEEEAKRHRGRGFKRVKTRLGRSEDYDVAALQAIRRGVGSDADILVDGSHRYDMKAARRMCNVLAEQKVFWFEEPFPPEDIDSYVALRQESNVPLAAGENEFGVQGFRELLRAGAVDIAQPDVCRTGGITECVRIGLLAAEHKVGIATHTWNDAVALIANAHVVASLPNGITVEVDQTGNPFIDELLSIPLNIKDGLLYLPDEPGLGISPSQAALDRLAKPSNWTLAEGNYSDLVFGPDYFTVPKPYDSSPKSAGGGPR